MNKSVTFFGKQIETNKPGFLIICTFMILWFFTSLWLVFEAGDILFSSPWLMLIGYFLLTVQITVNETEYAIIKNDFIRKYVIGVIVPASSIISILHYFKVL